MQPVMPADDCCKTNGSVPASPRLGGCNYVPVGMGSAGGVAVPIDSSGTLTTCKDGVDMNKIRIKTLQVTVPLLAAVLGTNIASASTRGCDPNDSTTWGPVTWGAGTTISDSALIGAGTTIGANAKIAPNVKIGACATIGNNVSVSENTVVGNAVSIGDEARLGDTSRVGDWTKIGPSSVIGPKAVIGSHAQLGKNHVWVGHNIANPAPNVTGPVSVGKGVILGDGTYIGANADIGDRVKAGDHVVIGAGATIGSNGALCDNAKIRDGMSIAGGGRLGCD